MTLFTLFFLSLRLIFWINYLTANYCFELLLFTHDISLFLCSIPVFFGWLTIFYLLYQTLGLPLFVFDSICYLNPVFISGVLQFATPGYFTFLIVFSAGFGTYVPKYFRNSKVKLSIFHHLILIPWTGLTTVHNFRCLAMGREYCKIFGLPPSIFICWLLLWAFIWILWLDSTDFYISKR